MRGEDTVYDTMIHFLGHVCFDFAKHLHTGGQVVATVCGVMGKAGSDLFWDRLDHNWDTGNRRWTEGRASAAHVCSERVCLVLDDHAMIRRKGAGAVMAMGFFLGGRFGILFIQDR